MIVAHISDTHLSARARLTSHNWFAFQRYADERSPNLVINTGDVVLDDPDSLADRRYAALLHSELLTEVLVTPGNHDVGDGPPTPWLGEAVTPQRVDAFRITWGRDRWIVSLGGWQLVGLNGLVLGALPDLAKEQWTWLASRVAPDAPTAVFMHKPLFVESVNEPESEETVPLEGREQFLEFFKPVDLRLVATGHLHEHHRLEWGGVTYWWTPSLGYLFAEPTATGEHGGPNHAGFTEFQFDADGDWTARLVRLAELRSVSCAGLLAQYGSLRFAAEAGVL